MDDKSEAGESTLDGMDEETGESLGFVLWAPHESAPQCCERWVTVTLTQYQAMIVASLQKVKCVLQD